MINDRQYGFRHGRSISGRLIYLTHRWVAATDDNGEGAAVNLDLVKAFNGVWHGALLTKLTSNGLLENLCKWIASFLTGRSIKIAVVAAAVISIPC